MHKETRCISSQCLAAEGAVLLQKNKNFTTTSLKLQLKEVALKVKGNNKNISQKPFTRVKLFVAAGALGSEVCVFQAMESLPCCLEPSSPPSQRIIATGGRRGLESFHARHLPTGFLTFNLLSLACTGMQGDDLSVICSEPCCTTAVFTVGCTSRRLKYTRGTNPALGFSGVMVTWL